jgi:copper resistance protein C
MILRPAWVLAAIGTWLCACAPAEAHAILISSAPAIDVKVPAGKVAILLRFNSRIDRARSRLTLDNGGAPQVLKLKSDAPVDEMDADAALAPGPYTLRWQVLAIDGHITRGIIPFTAGGH